MTSSAATTDAERPRKRGKPLHTASVARTERLSPGMVRVILTGPDLAGLPELSYTDHYVKMIFSPPGVDYSWPFDIDELRATRPAEQWPTTRTYTIRSFDREANELAIDFVVHGDEGLAGPWAAGVQPGETVAFRGPGGAYAPDPTADAHLLIGDEAAIPAIAAALERIGPGVPVQVFLEVNGPADEFALPETAATELHWIHRQGGPYGGALVEAVRVSTPPAGRLHVFAHGNADMIKELRRHLLRERELSHDQVSISGYWRTGQTEDRWQATKREFNATMEADDQG